MSFKPQEVLFASPLDRHRDALTAVRDGFGGGEVRCGAGFSEAVRQAFTTNRPVVGLCAAGILIRLTAPLLADKHAEPPVLLMTETGDFVPLLGGHHGANRLARDLAEAANGFALVSTATDALLGAPVEDPAPGYRLVNPHHAAAFQKALAQHPAPIALNGDWPLRSERPAETDTASALALGTEGSPSETSLVYAPTNLVLGVGCERGADADALVQAVQAHLTSANLSPLQVAGIASVTLKQDEPALAALAAALDVPLRVFNAETLAQVATPNPSDVVQVEIGTPSVSEAAALLGAGAGATLVLEKQKFGIGTVAVAQSPAPLAEFTAGQARGQVQLVGLGPGREDWRLAGTDAVLRGADHLVGYTYYTDQVQPLPHQQVHTFDLGEEERRCQFALDLAAEGKSVALICSGDAGVYAMGALTYELADRAENRAVQGVEIIANPGISAMFGAAARLGAPLGHDFCAISLSNLMTPWTVIERRLQGASTADFVVCFYNPVSRKRDWQLAAARDILLENRPPETPVVICRQIGRAEETFTHRTLGELDPADVDMFCMVLVGSSITRRYQPVKNGPISLYTPRGYLSRGEDHRA